jgi:uncharacterized protein YuzE
MQIKYFQDTDTLLFNFNDNKIAETKDISDNVLVELDGDGNVVSMTIEHAKTNTNINDFSIQQVVMA